MVFLYFRFQFQIQKTRFWIGLGVPNPLELAPSCLQEALDDTKTASRSPKMAVQPVSGPYKPPSRLPKIQVWGCQDTPDLDFDRSEPSYPPIWVPRTPILDAQGAILQPPRHPFSNKSSLAWRNARSV